MGILKSIKSVFKKKAEATPALSSEPPIQPEAKIDTEIKRKELRIGDMLEGRYEIIDIKEGGMGSVYIAYDNQWRRMFAIKSFQEKFLWNKNITNGFIKEAETWVNLGMHTNIVQAEFVKKIHGKPYIFLEYVDGTDLTSWIGKLDIPQSLDFAIQVCTGMEYAYNKMGIVHRDIKPSNVMITEDRMAKVTDFGLVKVFADAYSSETKEGSFQDFSLVKTGSAIGTPPYMSPEQFRDTKNVETESDIYSFGVMLYELLTGRLPFYADSKEAFMQKHLAEEPRNLCEINSEITAELDSIVMQCLRKNPEERYHSFRELKAGLMKIYEDITGEAYKLSEETIDEGLSAIDWNNRGLSLANLGRFEEAITCYSKALELNPEDIAAWNNKGLSLANLYRIEEAVTCYSKALEINPKFTEAWNGKGFSLTKLHRYEEAIICFDKALEINHEDDYAWNNKGASSAKLGRFEEAITCFDNALEINPEDELAWNNKGNSSTKLGRFEEAITCYSKVLELNPDFAEAWNNKGNSLDSLGRFEEAVTCYSKALELNPKDNRAWNNKGASSTKLGRFEEAITCYSKALELNPDDELAWTNKGVSLAVLGRVEEAITCFDKALKINPGYANAKEAKEMVLQKMNRR